MGVKEPANPFAVRVSEHPSQQTLSITPITPLPANPSTARVSEHPTYHTSELDNDPHFLVYYVYNEEIQRRHYENIKETRTTGQRLPSRDINVLTPYSNKGDIIMYVLTVNSIVTVYDNDKCARKAFHHAVQKYGINNVEVAYV